MGASTDQLASAVSSRLVAPVVNATGLKGLYDFKLRDSPRATAGLEAGDAPSLHQAVQTDLGLQLAKKKVSVDVFVVDHVEKAPTEN